MDHHGFFKKGAAVAMLAATLAGAGAARAEGQGATWLWSARVPLVNRSTEAMASGHYVRAAHFASAARAAAAHDADRLIASHNLCLALMAQGKDADARAHCRAAVASAAALTPDHDKVVFVRGALTTGAADGDRQPFSLAAVVRENIARAYGAHVVDHMAEEFTSAW